LALALLWLAGAGAVAMHASQPMRALRPFVQPGIAMAPQRYLDPPRLAMRPPAALLSALLFDPFVAAPEAQAQSSAKEEEEKKLASLSGTVFSTAGKAVEGATVRLVSANSTAGSLASALNGAMAVAPQTVPTTRSDAEGKFSFTRVPPGAYTITFQARNFLQATYGARPGLSTGTVVTLDEGRSVTDINMKLPEPGTFVGKTLDADGDPLAHLNVIAQVKRYYYPQARGIQFASATSGDDGDFRLTVPPGRYYIVAMKPVTWTINDRAPIVTVKPGQKRLVPGTTYWGGANNLKYASPVEIGPGQIVNLGNYKMNTMPMVHVRGKVIGDPALIKGARVTRVPGPTDSLCWSCGVDIGADGSFDMPDMYPYEFTIGAYSMSQGFLGITDIVVGEEDLDKVQIAASLTPFSGSVVVAGASPETQAAALPKRIELTSAGYYKLSVAAAVNPDGTFTIRSVPRGSYFLNVTGLARDTYIKSARFNTRDILTEPLDWGGDNGSIEIAISQKAPVLEGSVVDADGNPVPGSVTLVPDPPRPGHSLLYPTAKADQQGRFRFQSVAPGSYRIFAFESIPDGAHGVPDFMDPFVPSGERIELTEGGHKTMALKRISLDSMDSTLRRAGK
jgi:protocatechuate 3,4-dioxygenase beta subunit